MARLGLQAGCFGVASQQLVQDLPWRRIVTWLHDVASSPTLLLLEERPLAPPPDSEYTGVSLALALALLYRMGAASPRSRRRADR